MIEKPHLEVIKRHGPGSGIVLCLGDQIPGPSSGFASTKELFRSLGYRDCLTLDYNWKADLEYDLNEPTRLYPCNFDVVFDGGVIEHVANIGQSLKTIRHVTKIGGLVVALVVVAWVMAKLFPDD